MVDRVHNEPVENQASVSVGLVCAYVRGKYERERPNEK